MLVSIAGASGFIGSHLIKRKLADYNILGLSRSAKQSEGRLEWLETDLFSFESINRSLESTNVAVYLVHSMLPSTRLFQGNFQDTDLLLADNFAKACLNNKVEQIIYLGGLVPSEGASKHLDSRREVEEVFKATGIPLTILRAGMVVGEGGSSFEILKNLVLNLPGMLMPRWTKSNTQTIYIDDLISVISASINNESFFNKTINVVNGEKISYAELIEQTADYLDVKKLMIPVPINYTSFSKLWVKIFGEGDYELVSPLIDSLLCNLPCPETPAEISDFIKYKSYKEMLQKIPKEKRKKAEKKRHAQTNDVRSIQRLPNQSQLNQEELSNEYISWLPRYMKYFIRAERIDDELKFYSIGLKQPLLILKKIDEPHNLNRVKFHIVGGLLCKGSESGWFEFRLVCNGQYTLASINEFTPSLPWYIYKFSQAQIHTALMHAFGRHLIKISNKGAHL